MFYDGYPQKGRCPAGGGHVAQGYNFVLSHPGDRPPGQGSFSTPPVKSCTDNCATCTRAGLQCSLNNNCSFSNSLTPWACY
jgi:hypothetical protein